MILIWQCEDCKDIKHSIDFERPKLTECSCKKSFVDYDEEYFKVRGPIKFLKEIDADFYQELWMGVAHQGVALPIKKIPGESLYVFDISILQKIEEEIIKELY